MDESPPHPSSSSGLVDHHQTHTLRGVKFDDTGYVAGIVDYALTEERRQAGELGYTSAEWKALDASNYPLRLDHKRNVGRLLQTSVDNEGQLWVHAMFDRSTQDGEQLWRRVKSGDLHSLSIGFNALEPTATSASRRNMNIFKEVSVTNNPKKPHAKIRVRCSNNANGEADASDSETETEAPAQTPVVPVPAPEPVAEPVPDPVAAEPEPEPPQPAAPMETDPAPIPIQIPTPPVEIPTTINLEMPVVPVTTSIPPEPEPEPPAVQQMSNPVPTPMSVDPTPASVPVPVPAATPTPVQEPVAPAVTGEAQETPAARLARLIAAEQENLILRAAAERGAAAEAENAARKEKKAKKAAERARIAQEKNLAQLEDDTVTATLTRLGYDPKDPIFKAVTTELASNEQTASLNSILATMARQLYEADVKNKTYEDMIGSRKKPTIEALAVLAPPVTPQQQKTEAKGLFNFQKMQDDVKQLRDQQGRFAPNSTVPATGVAALEEQLTASGKSQASSLGITPQQQAAMSVDPEIAPEVIQYDREPNPGSGIALLFEMIKNGSNPGMEVRCSGGAGPTLSEAQKKMWPRPVGKPETSRPFIEMLTGKHSAYIENIAKDTARMNDFRRAYDVRVQSTPFPLNDEMVLNGLREEQERKQLRQRIRF